MNNPLRIALIGGNSKLGSAISRLLEKETDWQLHVYSSTLQQSVSERIFCKHIEYADIKKLKEEFFEVRPDFIINTAAMTNVDGCEIQRQEAWFSNVTFVEQLARLSLIVESHLIHFSTDYVFDGAKGPYTEQDQPNPICYYGKSKLAGENAVLKSHVNNTVIRTNVVYGLTTNDQSDFVQWVIKCHEAKQTMNIVDDQLSNPTLTDDLALSVKRIIEKKRCGLYHIGGNTYCNRYEFSLEIAKIFHLDESLITPIQTHSLNQKAKRPLRGGLINLKAHTDLGIQYSTIQEGLVRLRHHMYEINQE
ncbi:MAG: dTDP-4-dehydrorhamnose reductase [Ignavibacteria bacterium]|nr:dTDP-4-dehydrorhamnose reductase [Ignavibacteria bacterium]